MRLMRNTNPTGQCKYAIIRMDKFVQMHPSMQTNIESALQTLEDAGLLENPKPGEKEEFFVIKLKDVNSREALLAYSKMARNVDRELADDVLHLANRAGEQNPWCKEPD